METLPVNRRLLPKLRLIQRDTLTGIIEYADFAIKVFGYSTITKSELDRYRGFKLATTAKKYKWAVVEGIVSLLVTRDVEASVEPAVKWNPKQSGKNQVREAIKQRKSHDKAQRGSAPRRYS